VFPGDQGGQLVKMFSHQPLQPKHHPGPLDDRCFTPIGSGSHCRLDSRLDFVRTARAKGCGEARIMVRHVLRNAMIPILTQIVIAIPFLFTGSLVLESFFGIPGLGALMVEAIQGNDFATLRTMVFVGSVLFVVAQVITDVSYSLADPRVRLE